MSSCYTGEFTAIPAGALHNGVLSNPGLLIGESNVKDDAGLGGSDVEFSENSTSILPLTVYSLVVCNTAGITGEFTLLRLRSNPLLMRNYGMSN